MRHRLRSTISALRASRAALVIYSSSPISEFHLMALTATRIREQKRLLFLRVVRGARWFGATRLLSCSTERREKLVAEIYVDRVHTEHAVLDIGEDIGALVIYTRQEMLGKEIEVSPKGND